MRSRLISANSSRKILVKPRFGRRRCIGIWPPSKPLMRTPERAVWPLPPRPPVLPLPEPMPRPTRMRFLRAPGLSAISFSFIFQSSLKPCARKFRARRRLFPVFDHADEMPDLVDHAARLRRIRQFRDTADAIEAQPHQRLALVVMAPDRTAGLHDLYGLVGRAHV